MISVKPSIVAATAVVFGLFVAYRNYEKAIKKGQKFSYGEQEIKTVAFAWHELSSKLMQEATASELDEFMKEISERISYVGFKHGKKLEHIYVEELLDQLPRFHESWNEKYSNII